MAVKTKKCAVCKQNFVPMSTLAKACSPKCAIELTQRAKKRRLEQGKREQRRIDKARKQALETVPELTKKAQAGTKVGAKEVVKEQAKARGNNLAEVLE